MLARLVESLGLFIYPQLALSALVIGLCLAYLLAAVRGELRGLTTAPWRRQLEPLGGIAVSIGLLGSVWAFIQAFGGFAGGFEVDKIVAALGTAYSTTGVGLMTAIIAGLGAYTFDVMARTDPTPA